MCGEMLPDLRRRLQMVLIWSNEWCTMEIWFVWVMVCDMCVEKVLYGLQICVVVSSRLRCLIMLDLHGECGARNVQWWCFAWLTRCFVNKVASLCCGSVVAWPRWCYDGFPLNISELLVTMMWKLPTTSLMCKAVMVDDGERLSLSVSPCRSLVTRVVQAYLLDH